MAAVGDGIRFDENGNPIDATLQFLRDAQAYYLKRLSLESEAVRAEWEELRTRYASVIDDLQIDDYTPCGHSRSIG